MNALSLAHIAANEICARRSGPLDAAGRNAPARAESLAWRRAATPRLSQSGPVLARESVTTRPTPLGPRACRRAIETRGDRSVRSHLIGVRPEPHTYHTVHVTHVRTGLRVAYRPCADPARQPLAPGPGIGDTARVTTPANGLERLGSREWANEAVRRIEADANRSADTHLHPFPLPADWGIDLYLKDESVHPTGSLKHRLARSLFLYGLCNGWITERTTIVEASSGSTAVSEAYFARFLGLPFVAVMPASTSPEKIALIEAQGGSCHLVDDPADDGRRGAAARGRARRALPRPVHLRRARDGLARQQQHRGVDLQPDGAGATPRSRRGSWWGPEPAGRARRSAATRA